MRKTKNTLNKRCEINFTKHQHVYQKQIIYLQKCSVTFYFFSIQLKNHLYNLVTIAE